MFVRSETEEVTETVTMVEEPSIQPSEGGLLYYSPAGGGGLPEYIKGISNALHTICMVDGHKDYGETTEELMLAKIESDRIASIEEIYSWNTQDYFSNILSGVNSINYAVFYKNSNHVFTNCGVASGDAEEVILEKIGISKWAESYKDGKYQLITGNKNNNVTGTYASLHDWIFGSYNSTLDYDNPTNQWMSVLDDVSSAYFSYNNTGKADTFTIIEKSFESYGNSPLTAYLVLTAVCLAIACALCVYLLCVTGKTADGTKLYFFDKIPVEISFVSGFVIMLITGWLTAYITVFELFPFDLFGSDRVINEIVFSFFYAISGFSNVVIGLLVAVFFGVWVTFNMSVLRNLRNKTFCRHSLILRPAKWIFKNLWKLSKKGVDRLGYIFACDYAKGQGTKFKVLTCVIIALFVVATAFYYAVFVGFLMCCGFAEDALFIFAAMFFLLLGIAGDTVAVAFAMLVVASLHRIMAAASDMRKGNVDIKINTKFMPPFMKRFAEDILSIQDGLQNAVESAIKDQKMKAELITNVSHDLKTPLTSIVNYVDLLKKCEINDETAKKYVDVLDEKSHKMKKLIEDLVEASKASSGAVEIRAVKLNLCEFAAQTVGEHEDELKKIGIDVVLRVPEKPVMVIADAQKTMRIAENLFSNIRKYALESTRVYVDVSENTEFASITFKNISKNPLDVSAEELTRRFVRGDASRSGEGSGLGLSIAKDLCELQNGKLILETDGDLFKATVKLPITK
ncbi:MAG: HAMP domain-containing sensor histidine kinase [Acutalibacteraceae bacterium]|nr:HAMP domain-containing sensor histidine kinase [Acutalibacteraceae bacterium]